MIQENIGIQLKNLRKSKGVTIVELAEKTNLSQAFIVQVERVEIEPTPEQVKIIVGSLESYSETISPSALTKGRLDG